MRKTEDSMIDKQWKKGIKATDEKKIRIKWNWVRKFKITSAKANACTAMLIKDEYKKGIEREKFQNNFSKLEIHYD